MSNQDLLLAMAGKRTKARKRAILAPLRAAAAKALEPSLAGITFASGKAEELAKTGGLSWQDFTGARCSGCAGYTADDVRLVLKRRE